MEDKLLDFLRQRREAAAESAKKAKEKGGYAMLSYYHFKAKDAPYKQAISVYKAEGLAAVKKHLKQEYTKYTDDLVENFTNQKEFQDIVGKIEVVGEIIIFIRDENT
jgi:predicted ATPase with chaperone activity